MLTMKGLLSMLVFPYKAGSKGAKALAEKMGGKRIKLRGSKLKGDIKKKVVNWGAVKLPREVMKCFVFNNPGAVAHASNKRTFFLTMKEAKHEFLPDFTLSKEEATKWIEGGSSVVCRTKLAGHSGEGIVIADKADEVVDAPLYVKYIKKQQEYRIHVVGDKVIDIQRKARDRDVEDGKVNWRVRSHDNGFIFARKDVPEGMDRAKDMAIKTVATLGLDFGAVDLIYNRHIDKYLVLEVNTAPGLEGQTIESYAKAFTE